MPFDIVLVDDHKLVRDGVRGILERGTEFRVVGEAENGADAVQLCKKSAPDMVLMDIGLPGMNGIEATRIIHTELPEVCVIGLSMFEEAEQADAMRAAGVVNYLSKAGPSDAVITAIRSCVKREDRIQDSEDGSRKPK